jgi:hypothetical protein
MVSKLQTLSVGHRIRDQGCRWFHHKIWDWCILRVRLAFDKAPNAPSLQRTSCPELHLEFTCRLIHSRWRELVITYWSAWFLASVVGQVKNIWSIRPTYPKGIQKFNFTCAMCERMVAKLTTTSLAQHLQLPRPSLQVMDLQQYGRHRGDHLRSSNSVHWTCSVSNILVPAAWTPTKQR